MEVTSETLAEAVGELLQAEADVSANGDRRQWKTLFGELRRREANLDGILSRLSDGWFRMDGASSKLFVCAIAYRARTRKLFAPGMMDRLSELDKKVQYNLRDQAKQRLRRAVETWNDAEARKTGKAVRWHLMRKWRGKSHSMLSSQDRHYVEVELRDALARAQPGEWYFVAKEYVELNKTEKEKMTSEEIFRAKKEAKVFFAIDPDSEKSGVALVTVVDRHIEVRSLAFPEMPVFLRNLSISREMAEGGGKYARLFKRPFVVIEGGWLNESNWHVRGKSMTPAKAAAIGRNVGMNHQTGILIAQMCESYDIPYEVVRPLPKHWRGKDGKITAEELAYFTGYEGRTNQDERDAILLAWTHAGLPIKVKPLGKGGGR